MMSGLITGEVPFGAGTVAAVAVLAFGLFLLFRPNKNGDDAVKIDARKLVASR